METVLKDGQTILFNGDSITDCGRRDDSGRPFGHGYVRMFRDILLTREPEKGITVINKGISGNNVEDLRSRWSDDVLSHEPDWLSVKIGINDLHQYLCNKDREFLKPSGYREIYEDILDCTRRKLPKCQILLIDPFYISYGDEIEGSFRAKVWKLLPEYIRIVEGISKKFKTRHVRTHEMFQKLLKHQHPDIYCPEPVHPYPVGHLAIAEAIYKELSR